MPISALGQLLHRCRMRCRTQPIMPEEKPVQLLDSRGEPLQLQSVNRSKQRYLVGGKRVLISAAALLAAVTVAISNLDQISAFAAKVTNPAARKPILIQYHIYHATLPNSKRELIAYIAEEGSSLADIVISYEGRQNLLFDSVV